MYTNGMLANFVGVCTWLNLTIYVLLEDACNKLLHAVDEIVQVLATFRERLAVEVEVRFARATVGYDLEQVSAIASQYGDVLAAGIPVGVVAKAVPPAVRAVELHEAG